MPFAGFVAAYCCIMAAEFFRMPSVHFAPTMVGTIANASSLRFDFAAVVS